MKTLLALLFHQYIRTGDRLTTYSQSGQIRRGIVRVKGWGKYAAVFPEGGGAIRRDGIKQDPATGEWFYNYQGN